MADLGDIRREYKVAQLHEETASDDPLEQFEHWFSAYLKTEPEEPTAMTIATVDADGQPWQRTVLLKQYDASGFVFFTNYGSHKGRQLAANPRIALHFSWLEREQQIIIQGSAEKISREQSLAYFHSRPRDSQLGALASQQSQPVADRQTLIEQFQAVQQEYAQQDIPLPDHWGGFRVVPHRIEFWQGGEHRLHDRLEYRLDEQGIWQRQRLNP